MKIKLLFILIMLVGSYGAKASSFLDALQNYCVPTNENGCNSDLKATYNSTLNGLNKCECSQCGMYYDKASRTCKNCPYGTFVNDRNSTECIQISCGINQYMDPMGGGCPVNFYGAPASVCK